MSMHTPVEARMTRLVDTFAAHFGVSPDVAVQAPGRVNLIGEHTDYNDGFVLPCAIDRSTLVVARRRHDRQVRVAAVDMGPAFDQFSLDAPIGHRSDQPWCNYVRGMMVELQALGQVCGFRLDGADLAISGNVPQGAGLSSSASIEVAVGQVFKALCGLELDATTLARAAQRAENVFVGCNCGIMDQLVSAAGSAGHALLIDCRALTHTQIALPTDLSILIVHSRVRRGLVDSAYNERRHQSEVAAQYFNVKALRDVLPAQLQDTTLDATVLRRARHVVTENARTLAAANALARGDLAAMGGLMAASHASMRDDFEITVPPIDQLVDILQTTIGSAGGARMTGGGFGGCVVALLPAALVPAATAAVAADYRSPQGEAAICYVCRASDGASALSIGG